MVCLALELVGPWVVLGFSVGMEAFDELLLINVPWSRLSGTESTASAGKVGLIPGSRTSSELEMATYSTILA